MKYKNKSFKQFFVKSFFILASGTLLSQVIQILVYPFITRIFTPEDFGIKAFFTTVLVLTTSFSTGKYEESISLPKKDEEAIDVIILSIILSIVAAIFFSIFFYFFKEFLFGFQTKYDFLIYVILLPIGIIVISIVNSLIQWSMRKGEYKIMSKVKIIQSSAKGIFELSGGYFGFGGIILIVGTLIGTCGGVISYSLFFLKQVKKFNIKLQASFNKERLSFVLKKYINFPKFSVAAGLFNRLTNHLPILYFSKYATVAVLGHFSIAVLLVSILNAIFIESLLKIFYTEFASRIKSNIKSANTLFLKNVLLTTLVSSIIALGFFVLGKPFILFAFGEQWNLAGEILPYYGWVLIGITWFFISLYVFSLLEKQKWILFFNLIKLAFVSLGFFIAGKMEMDNISTIQLYVLIILVFSGIQLFAAFQLIQNKIKISK